MFCYFSIYQRIVEHDYEFFHYFSFQGTWKLKQGADEDTRMIFSPHFDGHVAIDENRVVITKVTNQMFSFRPKLATNIFLYFT